MLLELFTVLAIHATPGANMIRPASPVASVSVSHSVQHHSHHKHRHAVHHTHKPSGKSTSFDVPGMPHALSQCIAFRESRFGQDPAAHGNVYQIIPASGYDVAGMSLDQQKQVAAKLYAQHGGSPWMADGCPGT